MPENIIMRGKGILAADAADERAVGWRASQ